VSSSSSSSNTAPVFPDGSSPEERLDLPSALCSFGMRPHLMTGFLRQLFIQHFADPNNLEDATLRAKFAEDGGWNKDARQTGILIESVTKWEPKATGLRPAIIIKRNAWRWERTVIGNKITGANFPTGFGMFTGMWLGSHTIFALHREGAEAEILAAEVSRIVTFFGPLIRDSLKLHRFEPVDIGAVAQIEEATENFAVPVSVAYAAEEVWELEQHAPRLKRIVIKASELLGC